MSKVFSPNPVVFRCTNIQAVFNFFLNFWLVTSSVFLSHNSGSVPAGEDHALAVPWRSAPRSVRPRWALVSVHTGDESQNTVIALDTDHCACVIKPGGPPRPGMLPTPPMGGPPMMPMMGPPPHGMMPGGPGEATRCFSCLCSTK